jgi:hypothetical protein
LADKLFQRMCVNPEDWRIEGLQVVADRHEIEFSERTAGLVVFRHPRAGVLTVPRERPVKPLYVRRFVSLVQKVMGTP